MGTVHRPLAAASRGPVWALAAAAALLLLWLSSSGSGGGSGRGTALQLLAPWSPAARASGVAFCTSQEAAAQAAKFTSALQKEGLFTACPHHKWLSLLPGALEPGQDFMMLDVGCNKGFESAALFSIMDPEAGISPPLVFETLESVKERLKLGPTQGQCHDHKNEAKAAAEAPQPRGSVTVHCFEPSANNFRGLEALHKKFFPSNPVSRSSWHLHNMAVTNISGSVKFPSECNTELCSLGGDAGDPSQKASWIDIKATTLDDFAAANGLLTPPPPAAGAAAAGAAAAGAAPGRALFLKIDTEGFDPAVLSGARRLLAAQVPAVVLFEYHNKQAWATTSLRDVAFNLAASGYACYFDGQPALTRITGCWHDSLEIKNWSNVVCAVMGTKYHKLMESLSWAAARRL